MRWTDCNLSKRTQKASITNWRDPRGRAGNRGSGQFMRCRTTSY